MTSYPYLFELFKNVLANSKAISGRFYVCPNFGFEVNSENLGQVIQESVVKSETQKYPLVLLMPPRSSGNFVDKKGEWEQYKILMFFLKTTYYDSANRTSDRNASTGTSMHTIPMDWHDMKRSAINFVRVLDKVQRFLNLINTSFRLQPGEKYIEPISTVGQDRISGVKIEFSVSLFIGCELEDYDDVELIAPPSKLDNHPEHEL